VHRINDLQTDVLGKVSTHTDGIIHDGMSRVRSRFVFPTESAYGIPDRPEYRLDERFRGRDGQ
jgi:hypothetical protein